MIFKVITLFPEFFTSPLDSGLLGKAIHKGIIDVEIIDLRKFSEDKFHRCDDYPYGGGSGMVFMPAPLFNVLETVKDSGTHVILPTPSGRPFSQERVKELAQKKALCFICGHYEGIDQRVVDKYVDEELSVGDYILSGGEFAALNIIDACARYVPGFMSNANSLCEESFEENLLEYPHYTRPAEYEGMNVPDVLLSGNHANIEAWRRDKRIEKTKRVRPDLYKRYIDSKDRGK